jgi:integrase
LIKKQNKQYSAKKRRGKKMAKREKTKYPGVYIRMVRKRFGDGLEAAYGARIKRDGVAKDITLGRASEGMTAAKAAKIKAVYQGGADLPQDEKRAEKKARKTRQKEALKTLDEIWALYQKAKGTYGGQVSDRTHYERRIRPTFGKMAPKDITPEFYINFKADLREMKTVARGAEMMLESGKKWGDEKRIAAAKKAMAKQCKPLSIQSQYHSLALLRKLCFWAKDNLSGQPLPDIKWEIEKPPKKAKEKLTMGQVANLIDVCWQHDHPYTGKMILLALYTGARKREILNLRWDCIDYEKNVITLGVNLKTGTTKGGGVDEEIPMNSAARAVLKSIPKMRKNNWVFPSPVTGRPYVTIAAALNRVKSLAGLPDNFRIMHGCRHLFGTIAASLGGALATKELLKHSLISTSETYIGLDNKHWGNISEQVTEILHAEVGALPENEGGGQVIAFDKKRPA